MSDTDRELMSDEMRDQLVEAARRVRAFEVDMKQRGVHLGMGAIGGVYCVTCETPWPCEHLAKKAVLTVSS